MSVHASLVVGSDGSTTLHGSSDAISTPADRERFLARRRQSAALVIGGNTARAERYRRTPVPLVVISRTKPAVVEENPLAQWWSLSPTEAVQRALREFGSPIHVEGGITMIAELLDAGAISRLEMSITPTRGGENKVDHLEFLRYFANVEKSQIEETIFFIATSPIKSQK